jgi:hypothetical protein
LRLCKAERISERPAASLASLAASLCRRSLRTAASLQGEMQERCSRSLRNAADLSDAASLSRENQRLSNERHFVKMINKRNEV